MDKNCYHISSIIQSYLEELDYRYQNQGKPLGLSTGIKALDDKLGGLRGGEVILLAARPAMGKTSFAINLSHKIAKSFLEEKETNPNSNKCILYFSTETPKLRWFQRFISAELSDVCFWRLAEFEYGSQSYEEFERIANIGKKLEKLPIYVCDDSCFINCIEKKIDEICKHNAGFVIIDYLQLLRSEDKTQDLSSYVSCLKELAQKFGVPILVLSQLNRSLEKRQDKRPLMSDLRQGELALVEQAADVVMFLYRESYYFWQNEPKKHSKETEEHFQKRVEKWEKKCKEIRNECEIIVGKNRYGKTGIVKCFFDGSKGMFRDWEHSELAFPDEVPF